MEIKKRHIMSIITALVIIALSIIFLRGEKIFYFILGISAVIAALPFVFSVMIESSKERENDEMFLEFSRNLVENVKAGTPISKSILNLKNKYYGTLTPYVQKLANQISIGIPVRKALNIFAEDVNSKTINRAISLISEAEKAGGEIDKILESVAESISEIEELKKERKSAIYSLVVQGYIIFLVFIIIMLVVEFKILPMITEIPTSDMSDFGSLQIGRVSSEQFILPFLVLLSVQGFFAGLTIGKLAEGTIKAGIKHSFFMVILSLLISTGARAFLG